MGQYINVPTEDHSRHKIRIDADNFWHFSGFSYHSFSINVKIIFRTNEKVQKNKKIIQLNIFDRSITISWHVLSSIQRSRQLFKTLSKLEKSPRKRGNISWLSIYLYFAFKKAETCIPLSCVLIFHSFMKSETCIGDSSRRNDHGPK